VSRIYDILAPVLGVGGGVALLVLIVLLLLGPYRKFWVFLLYVSWELIATVGLTLADLFLHGTSGPASVDPDASRLYSRMYWTNDVIEDLLRFAVVTVLIYQVVGAGRPKLGRLLGGLFLAMMVLPFLLFHPTFQPYPHVPWFNSTSQLLNFGAAIMNVILWGALIQTKNRDPQIIELTIGLGVLVTGTAVSYGMRHFSTAHTDLTALLNLLLNLIQLAASLIWCRAFWPAPKNKSLDTAVPSP